MTVGGAVCCRHSGLLRYLVNKTAFSFPRVLNRFLAKVWLGLPEVTVADGSITKHSISTSSPERCYEEGSAFRLLWKCVQKCYGRSSGQTLLG